MNNTRKKREPILNRETKALITNKVGTQREVAHHAWPKKHFETVKKMAASKLVRRTLPRPPPPFSVAQ